MKQTLHTLAAPAARMEYQHLTSPLNPSKAHYDKAVNAGLLTNSIGGGSRI